MPLVYMSKRCLILLCIFLCFDLSAQLLSGQPEDVGMSSERLQRLTTTTQGRDFSSPKGTDRVL